jgi:hypothetical protein
LLLALGWFFGAAAAQDNDASPARSEEAVAPAARGEASSGDGAWLLILEPSFMRREVTWPIPGAGRTVFAAASVGGDGQVAYVGKKEWAASGLERAALERGTAAVGDELLGRFQAELKRDRKGVVAYGVIQAELQLVSALVFSDRFREKYEPVFGPDFLVSIPNRFTVFLFPKYAGKYRDYAPMILDAYRATPFPVSPEIFELSAGGLRAVGVFGE